MPTRLGMEKHVYSIHLLRGRLGKLDNTTGNLRGRGVRENHDRNDV